MMLEGLDAIDWAGLEYGSAREVPESVRGLLSEKGAGRKKSLGRLIQQLIPQGLAHPIAIEVVPFLVELVGAPELDHKPALLILLADLALGGDHSLVVARVFEPARSPLGPERGGRLNDAVSRGAETYFALLADRSAAVRAAAAVVVAAVPQHATAGRAALLRRLDVEKDEMARASILIALGVLDRHVAEPSDESRFRAGMQSEAIIVCFASAVALAVTSSADIGEDVVQELCSAVEGIGEPISRFLWAGGELRRVAALVLGASALKTRDTEVLSFLLRVAKGVGADSVVLVALLDLVFPFERERQRQEPRVPAELDAHHRAILERLVSDEAVNGESVFLALQRLGLPSLEPDLKRFLGLSAPGPLDEDSDGVPFWKRCRDTLDGRATVESWMAAVARRTPEQVVALCEDAASAAYALCRRWPWHHPRWQEEDADEAKLARLLSDTLIRCANTESVRAWASRLLSVHPLQRSRASAIVTRALLELSGTLPEEFDPLIASGLFESYAADMRQVLSALSLPRRAALVSRLELTHSLERDESGALYAAPHNGWLYVDLAPTAEIAVKIVATVAAWGTNPAVSGDIVPAEAAIEALAVCGDTALPALNSALAREGLLHRAVLEAAKQRIEASD